MIVRVSPGSQMTTVGGRYGDAEPPVLVVRVAARAVEGKANDAVVRALADAFAVPRGGIRIVSGHTSRTKLVEVEGVGESTLRRLLEG